MEQGPANRLVARLQFLDFLFRRKVSTIQKAELNTCMLDIPWSKDLVQLKGAVERPTGGISVRFCPAAGDPFLS